VKLTYSTLVLSNNVDQVFGIVFILSEVIITTYDEFFLRIDQETYARQNSSDGKSTAKTMMLHDTTLVSPILLVTHIYVLDVFSRCHNTERRKLLFFNNG